MSSRCERRGKHSELLRVNPVSESWLLYHLCQDLPLSHNAMKHKADVVSIMCETHCMAIRLCCSFLFLHDDNSTDPSSHHNHIYWNGHPLPQYTLTSVCSLPPVTWTTSCSLFLVVPSQGGTNVLSSCLSSSLVEWTETILTFKKQLLFTTFKLSHLLQLDS